MSSKRKQVTLAVVGSVGIHLIVLFAWAFTVQWFPPAQAETNPPPEQIKLEVVEEKPDIPTPPQPEPVHQEPTPKPVSFLDTADLPAASQPPKDATFQSDRNAEAASELPPTSDSPLPTQKGRPVPRFVFDTHPYTPGDEGAATGQNTPENMPPPVLSTTPPPPRPVLRPVVQSTPPPVPSASVPDPRDLAMVAPKSIPSTPAEVDANPYDPEIRPPPGMTEPPRPTPVPRRGGYRPFSERTSSAGNVGKIGSASVDSEATPSGRYKASVVAAIKKVYMKYFDASASLVSQGTVRIQCTIGRDGKTRGVQVVSNTANEALASISLQAVVEAPIAPIPDDVAAAAEGGQFPIDVTFTSESSPF